MGTPCTGFVIISLLDARVLTLRDTMASIPLGMLVLELLLVVLLQHVE